MAVLLGIDTGGTYTDAVLLDTGADGSGADVVAKAKALTTRHDLAIGIADAVNAVLAPSQHSPENIALVSLSTTLATNALVEGHTSRVALIAIGFSPRDLRQAGLDDALGSDPAIILPGGHQTHGAEAMPLDTSSLEEQLDELVESVSGFAVAGYFAVRNPAHELAVRDLLLARTSKPVTCSHELSAKLNGPKRALTTVLNARLVPTISNLIAATEKTLQTRKIAAPVMVVRGDGALVSASFATRRPIETILSGPAASLVGAHFLTGHDNAFVNDIGGTTSDIALLENGQPKLNPDGALVGGYRTMVEAVAMHTFGLGGDSEVGLGGSALNPEITLGPRRLVPISLLATGHHSLVHTALDAQLKSVLNGRQDGRFVYRSGSGLDSDLSSGQRKLYEKITPEPQAIEGLLQGTAQGAALQRLVNRGLVLIAGLTPSDAMHALGQHNEWDEQAAIKALKLFARRRSGSGEAFADDPLELARHIVARVERRSAEVVLETAFQLDGRDAAASLGHELVKDTLDAREKGIDQNRLVEFELTLSQPLIGLGASAHQYHPKAAALLATEAVIPEHADVANAIGAVVGQIMVRSDVTISQPAEGRFQVAGISAPFSEESKALDAAHEHARHKVAELARQAGAEIFEIDISQDIKRANVESRDMLIEAKISARATGRPPIAG